MLAQSEKPLDSQERLEAAMQRLQRAVDGVCERSQSEHMLRDKAVEELGRYASELSKIIKQHE